MRLKVCELEAQRCASMRNNSEKEMQGTGHSAHTLKGKEKNLSVVYPQLSRVGLSLPPLLMYSYPLTILHLESIQRAI